jgi:uncharacterized protein
MLSQALLSILLFSAGLLHLIRPEFFDAAIPFACKWEINVLSGLVEVLLAFGLCTVKLRDRSAQLAALWFLLLIPIHIYVSINKISMFGINHPALLWLRTLMQPALYFWALSQQKKGWIISQRWRDLIFLHYSVDPKKLQPLVPFPLDLYRGQAVVSIVPFTMGCIRFPFLIPIPGLSQLLELNLRTYIIVNGKPAVYFITLDSNHLPGVLIARWFFSLPYRWVKLNFNFKDSYSFSSPDFAINAEVGNEMMANEFDLWTTERYALFTKRGERIFIGEVEHQKWKLQSIEISDLKDHFSQKFGIELSREKFIGAAYSKQIDVKFKPFSRMK